MIIQRYKLKGKKRKGSYSKISTKTLRRLQRILKKAWSDLEVWKYYADYPSKKELVAYLNSGFFIHKYDDVIRQINYIITLENAIKYEKNNPYFRGINVFV